MILDDSNTHSRRSSAILDDSDPSRRFWAIRTIHDDPKVLTTIQQPFTSHSSPIRLPPPTTLRLPSMSPPFAMSFVRNRIKDWWEDKDYIKDLYVFL
nr:hypothetical protein CFP56_35196 [Quercus suber]